MRWRSPAIRSATSSRPTSILAMDGRSPTWLEMIPTPSNFSLKATRSTGCSRTSSTFPVMPGRASPSSRSGGRTRGAKCRIPLSPEKIYMTPSGYKLRLEKHPGAASWRLIGTVAEGLYCHKPCTVSGGGKSEISKSLRDYMIYGPIFVADVDKDFDLVQQIFDRDYADRWKPGREPDYSRRASRPVLSPLRSLGSVIKLLTPSEDYTDEYNDWLASFPNYIYPIVFIIKRFAPQGTLGHWRDMFGVDSINGFPGHELKAFGRKLVGTYLRVGLLSSQGWRTFKLRQDFIAAAKVQTEDDITASVVVPAGRLDASLPGLQAASYKFAVNCESRLFQRPDDAIHRGLDRQTEADLARPDNFLSNFEPLTAQQAGAIVQRVTEFDEFTAPMQQLLHERRGVGHRIRRLLGQPPAGRRQAEQEPALPPDPARLARPISPLRRRAWHAPGPVHPGWQTPGSARRCRARRQAEQSARPGGGHPPAGGLRPNPLPGIARAVHGLHLLAHRQESIDHRGRLGRGTDQEPVQRPAADRRSQRRPGFVYPHRPGGLLHGRGLHRPEDAGRPRHQPADPRGLVPVNPAGAQTGLPDRGGIPRAAG